MLIVVAIVGLASVATAAVSSIEHRRAAEEELLYVGDQYRTAIAAYVASTPIGQSQYPMALSDLLKDPRYPAVRRYLRTVYPDPVTGRSDWVLVPAPTGGIMGLHSASKSVPMKQQGFDLSHQFFAQRTSYTDWMFCYPDCRPLDK